MADSSTTPLPSPADFPEAEIVIYDGKCRFCRQQITTLVKWDGKQRLAFLSLHDASVQRNFPDLSHEKMIEQMYLITRDQRRLGGAEAVRYLSTRLPRMWIFAPILHFPGSLPLWRFLYKQVAKHRYRIAGMTDDADCEDGTCEVHFGD